MFIYYAAKDTQQKNPITVYLTILHNTVVCICMTVLFYTVSPNRREEVQLNQTYPEKHIIVNYFNIYYYMVTINVHDIYKMIIVWYLYGVQLTMF